MAVSERSALAGLAVFALTIAACDVLIGLNQYSDVACQYADCGSDVADTGLGSDAYDAGQVPETGSLETGADGDDGGTDADASTGDVRVPESGWPVPTGHQTWAHWPMPNPDAAIAPDSATMLPHTMAYDAGADASILSGGTVLDLVTGTRWTRSFTLVQAQTLDAAWEKCVSQPNGPWRVPTRIELLSLVDFTQARLSPTADPTAFPDTAPNTYWTSSPVAGDDGPTGLYWAIDFGTGLAVIPSPQPMLVRCVQGGGQ
jgi:hypothetical protein